ncbi:hypothetical protein C8J57DRAFT_1340297 [Mycena rebaudengoi]|nr:hypothetical protein C8J57DRAFT_1340297 [Mycena rebaudengoi]
MWSASSSRRAGRSSGRAVQAREPRARHRGASLPTVWDVVIGADEHPRGRTDMVRAAGASNSMHARRQARRIPVLLACSTRVSALPVGITACGVAWSQRAMVRKAGRCGTKGWGRQKNRAGARRRTPSEEVFGRGGAGQSSHIRRAGELRVCVRVLLRLDTNVVRARIYRLG